MLVQLLVPVRNEGENAAILRRRLDEAAVRFDSLKFIYDTPADTTIPFIDELTRTDPRVTGELNEYGNGVVPAFRWMLSRCQPGPAIVLMGDNSDKLSLIPEMVRLWREGAVIVAPSRYMPGGVQHGGGVFKSRLSRLAGTTLRAAGFPISDPTNNFKLYDGEWVRRQNLESQGGFEVSLELSYKAFRQGMRLAELPTEWTDRTLGHSRFRLFRWLPHYLRWYLPTIVAALRRGEREERPPDPGPEAR